MIRVPSGPQSGSETIDSAAFQFLGSSTASTSAPHFYLTNLVDTKRLLTFRADVNDAASLKNLASLLRYDTAYGRYHRQIRADVDALVIDTAGSRSSPRRTQRLCPGANWKSISCWSAPVCSRIWST